MVRVYDSLSVSTFTPTLEKQLLQLYRYTLPRESIGLCVSCEPVQQQRGCCDCGVFAIAFAYHIAAGQGNVSTLAFDQAKMRMHLVECLTKKALSPFPQTRQAAVKKSKLANIVIPVYCSCRRPDSLDEMIQCDKCDAWLHFQCAGVQQAPDDCWYCSSCRD